MAISPQKLRTFRLPTTNRLVAWAEFGSPAGRPLFFFHGTPSSRLECAELHDELVERNIRLIAPDRPGYGRSEFNPQGTIGGYTNDIKALAEHLKLSKYAVMGGSGGGPYALACARYISPDDGLRAASVFAGMAPWECGLKDVNWNTKMSLYMSKWTPGLMRWLSFYSMPVPKTIPTGPVEELKADPVAEASVAKKLDTYIKTLKPRDQEAWGKPGTRECLAATMVEAVILGLDGYMHETGLCTKEWDFKLEDIKFASEGGRPLILWYASEDKNTTIHMGRYIAERVPGAELREIEGESHYTAWNNLIENIEELLERGEI